MDKIFSMLAGILVGVVIAQIALAFFSPEIFAFFSKLVWRVRRFCGLED